MADQRILGIIGLALLVACGDDSTSGTGSGSSGEDTFDDTFTVTGNPSTTTTGPTTTTTTTTATGGGGCPAGTPDLCGDSCVDTNFNPMHCGGCFNECFDGEVCANAACQTQCPGGLTDCNGACVDTDSNPLYCGDCFTECEEGEVCSSGECSISCGGGTTECDGACVDTETNPQFCGDCDTSCGTNAGFVCVEGGCVDTRSWGQPQLVDSEDLGDATVPQLAVDGNGDAVAVWLQTNIVENVWANRYNGTNNTWGTAENIESIDGESAETPRVDVDDSGYAFAVWRQQNAASPYNIYANRYDVAGVAWGTETLLEADDANNATAPAVAVDGNGNATAAWYQVGGGPFNIYANRYDTGDSMWGTATVVDTNDVGNAIDPALGVDGAGNVVAVWAQSDGTYFNAYANRYDIGNGTWGGTAALIDSEDAGNVEIPQVAVDDNGNAVAVWRQRDATLYNTWANRYDAAGDSWGTATILETASAGNVDRPDVAIDASGNAIAVWYQVDGVRSIWSNRYDAAGDSWGTAQLLESSDVGNANDPSIALGADGNGVAVWHQTDGTRFNVYANRYSVGSDSWSGPELIEFDNAGNAQEAQVVIDTSGRAIAIWSQTDGVRFNIWSSRLD